MKPSSDPAKAATTSVDVQQEVWIAAAPDVVRDHYGDLNHRRVARVHPNERLRLLSPGATGPRYERVVRGRWVAARDVYEREFRRDGSVVDTCIAGAHAGRVICARFWRREEQGFGGTLVEFTTTQPLSPLLGRWWRRWVRHRIERELRVSAREDKVDVESMFRNDPPTGGE